MKRFYLVHAEARRRAAQAVAEAPDGYTVTIDERKRSLDQNAALHALIGEIAASTPWAGKMRAADVWKRLLTAAWMRARGESVEVLPALDGHGVDVVFRPTSTLTRSECSELLDFVQAWAAENVETATT